MKIHEYQAKELFRAYGIPTLAGHVVSSAEQAVDAMRSLAVPAAVVKAQVHAGGRGKGGGVKLVRSEEECRSEADRILSHRLVTPQTGPEGVAVRQLLVESATSIAKEFYLAVVLDRARQLPVLMASTEGGMEIEEVAANNPDALKKTHILDARGLLPFQARKIGYALGFGGKLVDEAAKTMAGLVKLYLEKDCSLVEINPWVRTDDHRLLALDGKINFDDNALFRHADVEQMRDESEEDPAELRAQRAGISFVKLDGNIGCLVNGAGLAMSTMDIIKYHGGEPANFLDVGGGANVEQVTEAFEIILADKAVRGVLVNIFGGIMKCDTIATAILEAFRRVDVKVPLVVRLEGTNVELGRKMLSESGLPIVTATDLTDAAKKAVAATAA